MTKTGTDRWGENGVSPVDDVDAFADTIATVGGAAPAVCLMEAKAWTLYKADPKIDKLLDRTRGQQAVIDLGYKPGERGTPVSRGRVGAIEFFTYNDIYVDDKTPVQLLPDYTVILGAPGAAEGAVHYGCVLDDQGIYRPVPMLPRRWVPQNPPIPMAEVCSASLPVLRRPDCVGCMTVR